MSFCVLLTAVPPFFLKQVWWQYAAAHNIAYSFVYSTLKCNIKWLSGVTAHTENWNVGCPLNIKHIGYTLERCWIITFTKTVFYSKRTDHKFLFWIPTNKIQRANSKKTTSKWRTMSPEGTFIWKWPFPQLWTSVLEFCGKCSVQPWPHTRSQNMLNILF